MKLSDELIGQARTALNAGETLKAGMFHGYATEVAQQESLIARVKALIPDNPELIEAGYAVPAADILAALKGA